MEGSRSPQIWSMVRPPSTCRTVRSGLFKLFRRALICLGGVVKPGRRASERGWSHETRGRVTLMVVGADFWRVMEVSISPPQIWLVVFLLSTDGTVWSALCKLVGRALICVGGVVKRGRRVSQRGCSHETWGKAIWMVGRAGFLGVIQGQYHPPQIWSAVRHLSSGGTAWSRLCKLVARAL